MEYSPIITISIFIVLCNKTLAKCRFTYPNDTEDYIVTDDKERVEMVVLD